MPNKGGSASASASSSAKADVAASVSALGSRVKALEKSGRKDKLFLLMKQKKDLLNQQVKSYSNNFVVKGIKFSMSDAQGDEEKEERFREAVLKIFVDQGLLPNKKVFVGGSGSDRTHILRGVVRNVHPLSQRDNASVVVAFVESWFVAQINTKLIGGKKMKNGIRIVPHLPPIIDAKKNEALKSRRELVTADPTRKIHLKTLMRKPWIQLVETKNGRKNAIDFSVDDHRLVNPALTLAKLELAGKDAFTLKAFLPADDKALISEAICKAKPGADDDAVDDDDASDDDMEL